MAEGIAVVVRVPKDLAASFPPSNSGYALDAPHVTVLYIRGEAVEDRQAQAGWQEDMAGQPRLVVELRDLLTGLASEVEPFRVTISGKHTFEPHENEDGRRALVAGVQSDGLVDLRAKMLERIKLRLGIDASGKHPGYVPHATLVYLAEGESYDGPLPDGAFTCHELEIWHGAETSHIELGTLTGW